MGMGRSVAGTVGTVALYGMVRSVGPWRTLLILFLIVAGTAGLFGGAMAYTTHLNAEARVDSTVKVQGLSHKQAHKTYTAGATFLLRGQHLDRVDSVSVGNQNADITDRSSRTMTVRIPIYMESGTYKVSVTAGQRNLISERTMSVRADESLKGQPFAWLVAAIS